MNMHFQFTVAPPNMSTPSEPPAAPATETVDLLRQILEVQKEQLALQRQTAAAQDHTSRWKNYLAKWQRDFPELPEACRFAAPVLEKTYGALIADLADHLRQAGHDGLENEYALAEFLDRYGMRLSQLGSILSLVTFLAEASNQVQPDESPQQGG